VQSGDTAAAAAAAAAAVIVELFNVDCGLVLQISRLCQTLQLNKNCNKIVRLETKFILL